MSGLSIGIDVGGTFTDLVAIDDSGLVRAVKVLSTPPDQSAGVVRALETIGSDPVSVDRIVHGTTVATNTLLERTGARVTLCATDGVEDVLALRRQDRAALYDLSRHHPPPLVDAAHTIAVAERIAPDRVVRPLEDASDVAQRVAALQPEIVAVALLHAYGDPRHERALARALAAALPETDVVVSSDVLPEIREYERTATTVAEAYLRPVVGRYLEHLANRLAVAGFPAPAVMMSSGGVRPARTAACGAAALALSGPAGGVVGAAIAASAAGFERALTIDIGGTSADVGLIADGQPLVEPGGDVAGVPIALPRVLVESVSAGGGSIAWIDDGGALRVGPRSAGAVPGPAAFGRGGTAPTVTDAHVALGHIRGIRVGAETAIDARGATAAIAGLAAKLGAGVEPVARAIIATADAAMARALRRLSVERGIDPRSCILVAFGGGGPLHGCGLAEELDMSTVLVPPHAGVLSALGLAATAERREAMRSVMRRHESLDAPAVAALLAELEQHAGAPSGERRTQWWAHARYSGQGHELDVSIAPGDGGSHVAERFTALHAARFGFTLERPVEIVSARVAVSGPARSVSLARRGEPEWRDTERVDEGAPLDACIAGPATVTLADSTMWVRLGWEARALSTGGWLLERQR